MKKILIAALLIIVCLGCDIRKEKLLLVNKTSSPIHCCLLTDTVLMKGLTLYTALPNDSVKPMFVFGGEGAWEHHINGSKDSTLYVFIFGNDSITDEVIANRQYKRLGYKVKDLDLLNWVVVYSGD